MASQQPPLPEGWAATWSPEHNAWFYFHAQTNTSQWEPPAAQAYPPAQPQYAPPPGQPQYAAPPGQQQFAPPPQQQPGQQGGLMGKFQSMDPKMQTALGVGGGVLAGALLEHEVSEFTHHRHHMPHMGGMVGLLGAAGAGALGAKLLGGRGQQAPGAPSSGGIGGALGGLFGGGAAAQPPPPPMQPGYPPQQGYPPQPGYPGGPPPPYGGAPPPPPGGKPNALANVAMGGLAGAAGAAAIGGVANMMHHHPGGSRDAGAGGGSFLGSLVPHNGPTLYIQAACFGDKDVTHALRGMVDGQQKLTLKPKELCNLLGDPWPEVPYKNLVVLYQYGDRPMEINLCNTGDDLFQITHEALSKERMSFINTNRSSRIIALVWGRQNILTENRAAALESEGEMEAKNDVIGDGGWYGGDPRVLQCFYSDGGNINMAFARQNGTLRMPWNALAKWS